MMPTQDSRSSLLKRRQFGEKAALCENHPTPNKTSILTPDPPQVESTMTTQPSTQKSERALGQA